MDHKKGYVRRTIEYYDSIADDYIRSDAAVVLKDTIERFIELLPGKKVLDVACGPGHDTDYMSRNGFECIGIDLSERMIALARKHFRGEYRVMDFLDLEFKDRTFDGMWCSSIFVHIRIEDVAVALKNANRVLKEGAVLGLITAQKQNKARRKDDSREYVMHELEELAGLLVATGFAVIVAETMTYGGRKRLFIIAKKTRAIAEQPGPVLPMFSGRNKSCSR